MKNMTLSLKSILNQIQYDQKFSYYKIVELTNENYFMEIISKNDEVKYCLSLKRHEVEWDGLYETKKVFNMIDFILELKGIVHKKCMCLLPEIEKDENNENEEKFKIENLNIEINDKELFLVNVKKNKNKLKSAIKQQKRIHLYFLQKNIKINRNIYIINGESEILLKNQKLKGKEEYVNFLQKMAKHFKNKPMENFLIWMNFAETFTICEQINKEVLKHMETNEKIDKIINNLLENQKIMMKYQEEVHKMMEENQETMQENQEENKEKFSKIIENMLENHEAIKFKNK